MGLSSFHHVVRYREIKMSKEMGIQEAIFDAIQRHHTVIIHRHVRPDGDSIGAQIGMKHLIQENFPEKRVFAVGDEEASLSFIGRMDTIPDCFYNEALVMILDTATHDRVSDARYTLGKMRITIDHHPDTENLGDIEWIDPSYTSTSEMIIDFLRAFPDLSLSARGRQALFCGVVTDTNRFLHPRTSGKTFERIGWIVDDTMDLSSIYQNLYKESLDHVRFRGYMMSRLVTPGNGLAYFVVDRHLYRKYGLTTQHASILANTLQYIEGISVWFVAVEDPETRRVRVSLRSEHHPINHIASQFGGGGHPLASGMTLNDLGMIPQLVHALSDYLKTVIEGGDTIASRDIASF